MIKQEKCLHCSSTSCSTDRLVCALCGWVGTTAALPFYLVMSYTMVGTIIGTKEVSVKWMNKL